MNNKRKMKKKEYNESRRQKSSFFEKKINKPLIKLTKRTKKKTHVNNIRDEKRNITTHISDINKNLMEYIKNPLSCKLENEEEIDNVLDTYGSPKLNQESIKNLNRHITSNKTKTVLMDPPTKRSQCPDGFTAELYQTFKKRTNTNAPEIIL
jgi:hypothetical protein